MSDLSVALRACGMCGGMRRSDMAHRCPRIRPNLLAGAGMTFHSPRPISELLREVCDRIERGEFGDKTEAEIADLYGLRESLLRQLPRVEEIERKLEADSQ